MTIENTEKKNYGGDGGALKCPNCSTPMQEIKRYDTDIDFCPACKGVWLDRGEIDRITTIQNRFDEEHYRRYHGEKDYDDYDDDYYHYRTHRKGKRHGGFFGDLFDLD